jgi:cytochrome c oxidase cbb3-type subunit III
MKFRLELPLYGLILMGTASALFVGAQTPANTGVSANGQKPAPGQEVPQPDRPAAEQQRRAEAGRKFLAIGDAPDPAAVARGKTIFVSSCGFCHGANADGGESGPNLVRSVVVLHDENGSTIGPVVLHGRPGKGMPAFASMTPAQISDIAAYLKSRTQAAANRMDYKIQNIVTGDAKAGEAFFNGEGHCNSCHSPTGDLAKIASKYEPVALQARMLYPRGHSRGGMDASGPNTAPIKVTVTTANGQTVSGTLEQMDDFNVSLKDDSGNFQTYPLEGEGAAKVTIHDPLEAHVEQLKKYTDPEMHNVLAYLETLK